MKISNLTSSNIPYLEFTVSIHSLLILHFVTLALNCKSMPSSLLQIYQANLRPINISCTTVSGFKKRECFIQFKNFQEQPMKLFLPRRWFLVKSTTTTMLFKISSHSETKMSWHYIYCIKSSLKIYLAMTIQRIWPIYCSFLLIKITRRDYDDSVLHIIHGSKF